MTAALEAAYQEFLDRHPRVTIAREAFIAGWEARAQSPADSAAPTHYAFLIRRKIDSQAWPVIYYDKLLAEGCLGRASLVVPVRLVECGHLNRITDGKTTECSDCKAIV